MANRLRKVKVKNEDGSITLGEELLNDMDDEERQMHQEEEERNRKLVEATQFRGIPFDKWLYVFLRYAFILAMTRRTEDAYEVLKKASNANVFYQDVDKKTAIRLAMVGCGVIAKNETIIQIGARWLCNYYQFQNDPYRLYMSVLSEGITDTAAYASYNQLRYLMRSIRLMDALVTNRRKTMEGSGDNAAACWMRWERRHGGCDKPGISKERAGCPYYCGGFFSILLQSGRTAESGSDTG